MALTSSMSVVRMAAMALAELSAAQEPKRSVTCTTTPSAESLAAGCRTVTSLPDLPDTTSPSGGSVSSIGRCRAPGRGDGSGAKHTWTPDPDARERHTRPAKQSPLLAHLLPDGHRLQAPAEAPHVGRATVQGSLAGQAENELETDDGQTVLVTSCAGSGQAAPPWAGRPRIRRNWYWLPPSPQDLLQLEVRTSDSLHATG